MKKLVYLFCILSLLVYIVQAKESKVVKFLYMTDIHVDDDFQENGHPIFTQWKPGDYAALKKTFEFINHDPYCKDIDFALFGGDQLNTGYFYHEESMKKEKVLFNNYINYLDIHRNTLGKNLKPLKFHYRKNYICKENLRKGQEPVPFQAHDLQSKLIVIQGNHDTCNPDFYRDCAWQVGDTRFIAFFAAYVGLPAPPGQYRSTGKIRDESIEFIEKEMKAAYKNKAIRHIVLVCHWSIADGAPDFINPIKDACPENKNNDNRRKLLELAEKYHCDLYINGHEHRKTWPLAKVGNLTDINCGAFIHQEQSWAIVEMHPDKAIFNIYSRAEAEEVANGGVKFTKLPQKVRTIDIPLTPIR